MFLYAQERDEQGADLDGLRLSMLSAIRDQETAIARELQTGDAELARLTAVNLAEMNQMVSGLEEALCVTVDNVPDMYEFQGPQNRDVSLRAVSVEEGTELLQAKVVPVTEVCENIDTWREAIGEEVASVINKRKAGAFKTESEVREMESKGEYQIVRVPGKLVAAIKPPRKLKARLVACGNFLQREKTKKSSTLDRTDLYCSNLDIFSLRTQLATGIQKGWKAASIDVKTAFLTAPFQAGRTSGSNPVPKLIMVKVPRAVTLAGFAPAGSYIQVHKALYGLQESPHSWSLDRDRKLAQACWKGAGGLECKLVQCAADNCIWKILDEKNCPKGTLGVYVDDPLFMTAPDELEKAILAVRSIWDCSETVYAESSEGMSFCGLQVVQRGPELWLHQKKYVEELRKRYPHLRESVYLPDFKDVPNDEVPTPAAVKGAQKIIGELTWISGRTRPDIGYCVNRMSRMTTVAPAYVQQCGCQVIRFLLGTSKLRIRYGAVTESSTEFCEALPMARSPRLLETFCDASFAQQDGYSQTGIAVLLGGQLIGWLSLRQPFIALSTAEAEVVSCTEGIALTQALKPLVEELVGQETTWVLINDNIACSAILSYPSGSWRSRRLRLRSRALQEMIFEEIMSVHHVPGCYMVADILTKPLNPTKVLELLMYMGFDMTGIGLVKKGKAIKASEDVSSAVRVILLTTLATPVKGQGEERLCMAWDISGILLWLALAVVVLVCCLLAESRKRRRLRILRNQADMASHEVRPVFGYHAGNRGGTAPGSHDPVKLPSEPLLSVGVPVSAPPGAPTHPSHRGR